MAYGESIGHVTDDVAWPQYAYGSISQEKLELLFSNNH